ncbi:MAG: hypothetical protein KAS71_11415 [Bacteroidales bacterium]|nr:hypothetical protein [Bacteroidales bacterium]
MRFPIQAISAKDIEFNYFGNGDYQAVNIAGLSESDRQSITFYRGDNLEELCEIEAGILLVEQELEGKIENCKSSAIVFCDHPKYQWIKIIAANYSNGYEDDSTFETKDETIRISKDAYIESNVIIGSFSQIYPKVCLYKDTIIGKSCEIQSGSVIGGIGLGDVWYKGKYHKLVHLGRVIIENNVSIGTNVSVLKGMLEETIIGEGTKIGNNVNIGHNVVIGKNCYISSGVTIGGACIIEDNCWLAVGASLNDHIHMKKNSKIGTGSVLIRDTLENGFYLGNPARKISDRID